MIFDDELTNRIIGCAIKVHNTLGNACLPARQGFQEVIYQRCLAIELERSAIVFGREIEQPIFYEGIDVGTRRADFMVENKVIVELKAVIKLEDVHLAQAKNYLTAYNFETPKNPLSKPSGKSLNPVNPDADN